MYPVTAVRAFIPGFIAAVVLFALVLVWNGITGGQVLGWLGGVSSNHLTEAIAEVEATPGPQGELGPQGEPGPPGPAAQ